MIKRRRRRRKILLSRNIAPIEGELVRMVRSEGSGTERPITLPIIRTGRDPRDIVPTIRIQL